MTSSQIARLVPVCLFLLGIGSSRAYGEAVALTFDQLPGLVAKRNKLVESARLQIRAAESRTGSLGRSFLPEISAEGGYESFETGDYSRRSQPYGSAEARLNLFRGGRDAAEARLREAQKGVAAVTADKTMRDELLSARILYWDLVYEREMIKAIKEAIARNQENIRGVERRIQKGLTTGTDRLEFEMHRAELEEALHSHEHEIILIEASMAPLLGYPLGTRFAAPDVVSSAQQEDVADLPGEGASPDQRLARANAEIAAAQSREAAVVGKPSLDLYGGYHLYTLRERDYLDRDLRDDIVAGGRIELALFDGGRSARTSRFFRAQSDAFQMQSAYFEQRNAAERKRKEEELNHERELIESSGRQLGLVRKYVRGTLGEYDRGVKNAPDVASALNRLVSLQRQDAARRRDYQKILAELMSLAGR